MKSIADSLHVLVSENNFLQYGLQKKLFNLTALSRLLQPLIEVRTQKNVSLSALIMAVSRYQKRLARITRNPDVFIVHRIAVHTDLSTFSFEKTAEVLRAIHQLHTQVLKRCGYITICEGTSEVTVILGNTFESLVRKLLGKKEKFHNNHISALAMHFPAQYAAVPGFLSVVLQQTTLQGINVIEVASTFTEFVLYVDAADTKLAFDTLYHLFRVHEGRRL